MQNNYPINNNRNNNRIKNIIQAKVNQKFEELEIKEKIKTIMPLPLKMALKATKYLSLEQILSIVKIAIVKEINSSVKSMNIQGLSNNDIQNIIDQLINQKVNINEIKEKILNKAEEKINKLRQKGGYSIENMQQLQQQAYNLQKNARNKFPKRVDPKIPETTQSYTNPNTRKNKNNHGFQKHIINAKKTRCNNMKNSSFFKKVIRQEIPMKRDIKIFTYGILYKCKNDVKMRIQINGKLKYQKIILLSVFIGENKKFIGIYNRNNKGFTLSSISENIIGKIHPHSGEEILTDKCYSFELDEKDKDGLNELIDKYENHFDDKCTQNIKSCKCGIIYH